MSFKFEGSCLKRLGIWKPVNRLRVSSTILVKLTFLTSGATSLICLPTSLGEHFSKIKAAKRGKKRLGMCQHSSVFVNICGRDYPRAIRRELPFLYFRPRDM